MFEGPLAKFGRGKQHLETLDGEIKDFLSTHPYEIVHELDPKTGDHVFIGRVHRNAPITLSVLVGDVVHNFRSALDLLVADLTRRNGAKVTHRTAFPMYISLRDYWHPERGAWSKISGLQPDQIAVIEKVQPYRRTDRPHHHELGILSKLSNRDKHDTLNMTATLTKGILYRKGTVTIKHGTFEDGTVVGRFSATENVDVNAQYAFDVAFKNAPLESLAVRLALARIGLLIEDEIFPPLIPKNP